MEGLKELKPWAILLVLAGLAILAYLPVFTQPFVADDFVQIHMARRYAPVSAWPALFTQRPLYRCRSTSLLLTHWTEQLLGFSPLAFYSTSVALHVVNTWLVFALGAWPVIGWRVAAVAAAFFAVHEGHQEAVMWYAALPELLVFLFVLLAAVCWAQWLQSSRRQAWWYAATLASFVLALASKESGVVTVPLLLVLSLAVKAGWRRLVGLAPFAGISLVYFGLIFSARGRHLHFNDGTFSLDAPVWITWSNSFGRLLWIWGVASLLALLAWRVRRWRSLLTVSLLWISITLLPYCFLLYMPRVPSRHTYLASAGLALIVAAAFLEMVERCGAVRRWAVAGVAAVILFHNVGCLWIKKRAQFLERAAPSEKLIELARHADGPIYVHCFPYGFEIAQRAVEMVTGKSPSILVFDHRPPQSSIFCLGHPGEPQIQEASKPVEKDAPGVE